MRLDHFLFTHHYTQSRNQAKALILSGEVCVDGLVIRKPAWDICADKKPRIEILQKQLYVSRAALKLKAFLSEHHVRIEGRRCLDIGSSTGGFVQVLLEMGAREVTGVDVGREQLHSTLRDDPRVVSVEETDIRDFDAAEPFDLVTCDVSFVGVAHILRDIDRLAGADILLLFKPQFEVGPQVKRTRKGVVKDQKAIERVKQQFVDQTRELGWELITEAVSKIKGKEGNVEIFFQFRKK